MKFPAHRLRSERKKQGLLIQDCAVAAEMSARHWSDIENGRRNPGWELGARMWEALGFTVIIAAELGERE